MVRTVPYEITQKADPSEAPIASESRGKADPAGSCEGDLLTEAK